MKKVKNKVFAVVVLSTIFMHIMMLLNRHRQMRPNYSEGYWVKGEYYYFVNLEGWTINIIYCLYFIYIILIVLRVVDIRDGLGIKTNKDAQS